MVYIITYDLNNPGQDYQSLFRKIQSLGEVRHPLQNLWILSTNYNATKVRDEIRSVIDPNDKVFIAQLYRGSYAAWMLQDDHNWLEQKL